MGICQIKRFDPFLFSPLSNTIIGDRGPADTNPNIDGIQTGYDDLGNLITDPNSPAPDKLNILFDSSGSDRIEGKGGNDEIYANQGGDDWILGGDGEDGIMAGSGNDISEGGTGSDGIYGGSGNDQLFGENKGDMATLIAPGETAANINEKGDLLAAGNEGNDYIQGGNLKFEILDYTKLAA